jgi:polyhydroxyalkanoate synthesis repressor PhaR
MSDVRIIKKYPNRRLYDTEISRYITLEEVRQLVLQNVRFKVEDKRSHEDITRSILLQVIAEQEEGGDPIFTSDLLTFIIRFYSPSSCARCWARPSSRWRRSRNWPIVRCRFGARFARNFSKA